MEINTPDAEGVVALVRLMAAAIHVRGDFLAAEGRRAAIAAMVQRLECGLAQPFGAQLPFPPRLVQAKAMGLSTDPWHANQLDSKGTEAAQDEEQVILEGLR